jgi:hypothetical protein
MTTPSDRRMIASTAALTRWARTTDTKAALAPARQGFRAKFEREAAELGITDPALVFAYVDRSMRAHMTKLARKSATARRKCA